MSTEDRRQIKKCAPLVSQDTITALGHGTRVDVLRILNERTASSKELAEVLDEAIPHVSYHVRVLEECSYIEAVATARRRGALQTFYRATKAALVDDELSSKLPESVRQTITVEMLEAIYHEAAESIKVGTFDRRVDRHVSWMPMRLDEDGWRALIGLLADTLSKAEQIKAENAERLLESDDAGHSVIVSLLGFETAAAL